MKGYRLVVAGITAIVAPIAFAQAPTATVVDFEAAAAALPCEPGLTGGGAPVEWQLLDDPTAPAGPRVLAETSGDATNFRFPLCILPDQTPADVSIVTSFKAVEGRVDQAAGVMVRLQDANNYYIARANALEGNVRFYKVENGQRIQIASANVVVANGQWQTLELRMQGNRAEVLLNGVILFDAVDETFAAGGRVGVWTKADSLTYFDGIVVTPL
jgi:hypothetical protein